MEAGQLRQFIRFEVQSATGSAGGGEEGVWVEWTEEPAFIERLRSMPRDVERLVAGGVRSLPVVRIWVRANDMTETVTSAMRAYDVDRDKYFNINAVQDIAGDGRWITVTATENAPA